jgi:ABC-type nitrate/sulfonate/bicarbonate transport system substrate-binding protein
MKTPVLNGWSRRQLLAGGLGWGASLSGPILRAQGQQVPLIRLQSSWISDAEFIGYFVALSNESAFYTKAGISAQYLPGGPQVTPESSLLNGTADVALTTPETTTAAILRDNIDFVIIATQYQVSPIGIVSLAKNPVPNIQALKGKRLAVAPVNRLAVDAILKLNNLSNDVTVVPYQYDPRMLLNGAADASVDFVTNVPYAIRQLGEETRSFLLYDAGLKLYNDTVVVRRSVLDARFEDLARFLAGTIMGWKENYSRPYEYYPQRFAATWFSGTGRTVQNEIEFNRNQRPLIDTPAGLFEMTDQGISDNIAALELLGLKVQRSVFNRSVLQRAREIVAQLERR